MKANLQELIEQAATTDEPRVVEPSSVKTGGVDPLGLRQINFDLMDLIFPNLNNVASHVRPYVIMAWAWRRVRRLIERGGKLGAIDQSMRDFADRIEAIYAWSQFLNNRNDIPGGQAMRELVEANQYRFSGDEWVNRRDVRRYSTGLISPLNYGPSLQSLGWLTRVADADGVFSADPSLDPMLDEFETLFADELDHPAFNIFDDAVVLRDDAARWGLLWAPENILKSERDATFSRLAGELASETRQNGIALVRAAYGALPDPEPSISAVRGRMADLDDVWAKPPANTSMSSAWRDMQVRQVFRLALEALFHWTVDVLNPTPMHSRAIALLFLREIGTGAELQPTAQEWLLSPTARVNPVLHLQNLEDALDSSTELPSAIVAALRHCIQEAPEKPHSFESFDRLPLARAREEALGWAGLSPVDFMIRVFEVWVLAQHAYWCVGRGLADARNGGKIILRLRIVMDDGGWALTSVGAQGNAPQATPDRLETTLSLLDECQRL